MRVQRVLLKHKPGPKPGHGRSAHATTLPGAACSMTAAERRPSGPALRSAAEPKPRDPAGGHRHLDGQEPPPWRTAPPPCAGTGRPSQGLQGPDGQAAPGTAQPAAPGAGSPAVFSRPPDPATRRRLPVVAGSGRRRRRARTGRAVRSCLAMPGPPASPPARVPFAIAIELRVRSASSPETGLLVPDPSFPL